MRELIAPPLAPDPEERDQALSAEAIGRGVADSVFSPGSAPSEDELARAMAAAGIVDDRLAERLAEAARATSEDRLRPGPLRLPAVLERMGATALFGPSTVEEYALCPPLVSLNDELEPQRIGPQEDAPTAGHLAHKVLERLYQDQPGGERRPTRVSRADWQRRARELIAELGSDLLPENRPDTAAARRRVEGLVLAFIADEARAAVPFLPDPDLAEASFGFDGSSMGPLQLEGGGVHGRIDRIDIGPGGEALVQDYKSGGKVDGGRGMLERGKLQLQLYLLAARELWGLDLAGGLYRPLGATSKRQPKGLLRKDVTDDLVPLDPRPRDRVADEEFEGALDEARGRAEEIVAAIHGGDIGRRPLGDRCPDWCSFQPICRRERGLPEEEPETEEEPEE